MDRFSIRRQWTVRVGTAAIFVGVGALLVAEPAAAKKAGPVCDGIARATLAQTARWRVLETYIGTGVEGGTVVACRRTDATPVRVRALGVNDAIDPDATDRLTVSPIAGDRIVVSRAGAGSQAGGYSARLVDLGSGGSALIGSGGNDGDFSATAAINALAPNGGLASATWTARANYRPAAASGPLMLWGAGGPVASALSVSTLAPSAGDATHPPGAYYVAADGTTGRIAIPSPAPREAVADDPTLRWQRITLPRIHPPKHRGTSVTVLPFAGPVTSETNSGQLRVVVKQAKSKRSQTSWIEYGPKAYRLTDLAPGTAGAARVVGVTDTGAFVTARFADRPHEMRLRYLLFSGADSHFDVVAPAISNSPGVFAFDQRGRAAYTDGRRVVVAGDPYTTAPFRSYDVPGAHDLVFTELGETHSVFVTDAAGTVTLLQAPS